jgi:O-methyltransferase/methyltransferase family protein
MSRITPEQRLWNLARGALATRALAVVAELGVADVLADGPRPVAEIAREVGADADSLRRLLRALASDGVFAEHEAGVFGNTDASESLRRDHPERWLDFAHLFGGVFFEAVATIDATTREATFPRAFGTDFWSWLAERPEERASFDRAMSGGKERSAELLAQLDWRGDETVVDVGGGNGALLIELLRRQPGLHGVVFDLPETDRDEAALGDRIEFVAGSFFDRVPRGDVYLLSAILHDWDDERATAILRTVRAAAPDEARLLVRESVIAPGNEPNGEKWLDLLMLALLAGRERTEPEWTALLEEAGFRIERIEDGLIQARCL